MPVIYDAFSNTSEPPETRASIASFGPNRPSRIKRDNGFSICGVHHAQAANPHRYWATGCAYSAPFTLFCTWDGKKIHICFSLPPCGEGGKMLQKVSSAVRGRLAGSLRQSRRGTIYKMLKRRNNGFVPCFVCGKPVVEHDATLEHIMPRSKGGTDSMSNLAISHKGCNLLKGNK